MPRITIGQVARRADVSMDTVRFYERRGLLREPPRNESGYRLYDEDAVQRLRFIRRAKALGFTLSEITDLLVLDEAPSRPAERVREQAQAKLDAIDAKLRDLHRMREVLLGLTEACDRTEADTCPILEALTTKGAS